MSAVLGWILVVVGVLFILLGLAAAAKDVLKKEAQVEQKGDKSIWEILTELVKALTAAPQWLALTIIGIGLVVYGSSLAL